jgi:hypothetical protein
VPVLHALESALAQPVGTLRLLRSLHLYEFARESE